MWAAQQRDSPFHSTRPIAHHGLAWLFTRSHGKEHTMNPTQCDQPAALFAACMHAGGWPKLGFQCQDDAEEVLSCYDDIILL
jgi:hypothetical protein